MLVSEKNNLIQKLVKNQSKKKKNIQLFLLQHFALILKRQYYLTHNTYFRFKYLNFAYYYLLKGFE